MTYETEQFKETLKQFLLGQLGEVEREKLESAFIEDPSVFEQLTLAEEELIEQYVCGMLTLDEKSLFESNYMASKAKREKVAITRALIEEARVRSIGTQPVQTVSFWESIAAYFRSPVFAAGIAALLLIGLSFWLIFSFSAKEEPLIARNTTPSPTQTIVQAQPTQNMNNGPVTSGNVESPKTSENESNAPLQDKPKVPASVSNEARQPVRKNRQPMQDIPRKEIVKNLPEVLPKENQIRKPPPPPPIPSIPTLALISGTLRSPDAATKAIKLDDAIPAARLELYVDSKDYKQYRADIVDQDGKVVFKSPLLARNGLKVNLLVPSKKLQKGDYIVRLSAVSVTGEDISIADYQFRVDRR